MEFIAFLFHVTCAVICFLLAKQKGRSGLWCFAGFFFSIIGVILLLVASDLHKEEALQKEIHALKSKQRDLLFKQSVTLGSREETPRCMTCRAYSTNYRRCSAFDQIIAGVVVGCDRYQQELQPSRRSDTAGGPQAT
jgi:RsiW-degrading membrane proteinase PrsW (M82 family)